MPHGETGSAVRKYIPTASVPQLFDLRRLLLMGEQCFARAYGKVRKTGQASLGLFLSRSLGPVCSYPALGNPAASAFSSSS